MVLLRVGLILAAVAALTWTVGFVNLDFMLYGLSCLVLTGGYLLAAFGKRTIGMAANAVVYGYWTIGFILDGFGWVSIGAAAVLAAGSLLAAWPGDRLLPIGIGASIAGNMWYLVDNSFLTPYAGFAIGNWLFTLGMAAALFALVRTDQAAQAATAA